MEVISKREARARGLKRYFTALPCIHGHLSERTVNDGKCCECDRLRQLAANLNHAELKRRRSWHRAYYRRLTPAELERRAECMRNLNREPEQAERNRARHRVENMTAAQLAARQARTRAATMTQTQIKQRRDRIKRNSQYRRALKLRSGGRLSPNIHATLFEKQRGQCVYCEVDLTTVTPHLDHRMPLTLGGTNTDDNVQLLCPTCNTSKGNQHPDVYEARIGYRPGHRTQRARVIRRFADA